jgi:amino acid permease
MLPRYSANLQHKKKMDDHQMDETSAAVAMDFMRVVFTTVKCNWGIGMMAMPYLLLQSGFGAGIILFIVAMWLSWLAVVRLSDCRITLRQRNKDREPNAKDRLLGDGSLDQILDADSDIPADEDSFDLLNYSDIVRAVMGNFFGDASILSILIAMYGSNISYIVFIKENMVKYIGLTGWEWILIVFAPLTVLVLKSDLKFLTPVSIFGLTCSFSFLFLVVYRVITEVTPDEFHHK